jgi:hypothetical protein
MSLYRYDLVDSDQRSKNSSNMVGYGQSQHLGSNTIDSCCQRFIYHGLVYTQSRITEAIVYIQRTYDGRYVSMNCQCCTNSEMIVCLLQVLLWIGRR